MKKARRTDQHLLAVGAFVQRGKASQEAIYNVAGKIAATLLTRVQSAEPMDEEAINALAAKVINQALSMALTLWHAIDDRIHRE